DPARQHGDISDERDIAHEVIALRPGVAPEDFQFALIGGEAKDRVERGGLAGAVGTDESEDSAFFDAEIDAVERDRGAECLAEAACFYGCHGFSSLPRGSSLASAVPSVSSRAAESSQRPSATLRQETAAVGPASPGRARPS